MFSFQWNCWYIFKAFCFIQSPHLPNIFFNNLKCLCCILPLKRPWYSRVAVAKCRERGVIKKFTKLLKTTHNEIYLGIILVNCCETWKDTYYLTLERGKSEVCHIWCIPRCVDHSYVMEPETVPALNTIRNGAKSRVPGPSPHSS